MSDATNEGFYILSIKWSSGDHLTWWRPDAAGYTVRLDNAGIYSAKQIEECPRYYNNGEDTAAIPVSEARKYAVRVVSMDFFRTLQSAQKENDHE